MLQLQWNVTLGIGTSGVNFMTCMYVETETTFGNAAYNVRDHQCLHHHANVYGWAMVHQGCSN